MGHNYIYQLFIIKEPRPFFISLIMFKILKIQRYQKLAKEKGGKCLSTIWVNSQYNVEWECANKHKWKARPNNIQQGQWCPICSRNK